MGIPDHLTCLLRSLYAGQEATVRTGHGTTDWFQIGKRAKENRTDALEHKEPITYVSKHPSDVFSCSTLANGK